MGGVVTEAAAVSADLRDCRLYRFWVEHPVTGRRVLGYVGETVRLPFERLLEHVYAQPWADTIVAWEVDEEVFAGKDAVLRAEARAIRDERPLYNVIGNGRNRGRVKPWDAVAQRHARDDAAGRPRWVKPDEQTAGQTGRVQRRRQGTPQRGRVQGWGRATAAAWAGAWLLLAAMLWQVTAGTGWALTGRAWAAAVTPGVVLVVETWRGPRLRRWARRRIRRWAR
jgi:hypothetical protein